MATKKTPKTRKLTQSEQIEELSKSVSQLTLLLMKREGVGVSEEPARPATPPASGTVRGGGGGVDDRVELQAQVVSKDPQPGNRTLVTFKTQTGRTFLWKATSVKGASLDVGSWYLFEGRIKSFDGNLPVLHYVLFKSDDTPGPGSRKTGVRLAR